MSQACRLLASHSPVSENELVLVDDDPLTHDIVTWILKKGRHTSQLFTEPVKAFDYLCLHQPRLLVVDYYMPRMNGLELIRNLHRCVNLEHTTIMLCSAITPDASVSAVLVELGVAHLDKDIIGNREQLTQLLDDYLG